MVKLTRKPIIFRGFLLLFMILSLLSINTAEAMDWNWNGGTSDYNTNGNWVEGSVPSGQNNRAIFSNLGLAGITFSADAPDIGRVLFDLAAQAYTFTLSQSLSINGVAADAGIVNQSGNVQTYNITAPNGRLRLQQSAALTGNILINNNAALRFRDTSTAGNSMINHNGGDIQFRENSSASTATIVSNSTVRFQENSTAGAANLTNNAGFFLLFDNDSKGGTATIVNHGTLNFNNNSDAQNSQITNDGTVNFIGSATADNATIANAGMLNLSTSVGIGSLSGAGAVDLGNNTLSLGNLNQNNAISGAISGNGSLIKVGTGNLTLTGANTYTGNTTITNGVLTFTGATNGLMGNIINNAALVFNQAANSNFNQVISGNGTVTKSGVGALTLVGNNTYNGGTSINGGTLSINANNRLGVAAGGISFNGGTLLTTATFSSNRGVTLNAGGGTFNTNGGTNFTLSGVINGTGSLTKVGNGLLSTAGANTYTGDTIITNGSMQFSGDTSNLSGNILIQNNSLLLFAQAADSFFHGLISGIGRLFKVASGNLTLSGANTYTGNTTITNGVLTFTGATNGLLGNILNNAALVFNQAANSSFNQVISGAGTVTKSGAGNLTLTGNNTYTGNTAINGGTLTFTGATNALGGNIINNAALVFNQAANSSFNQVISGPGTVTKSGTGSLTFTGANNYSGDTTILNGALIIRGDTSNLGGNIINNDTLIFIQSANSIFNHVISGVGRIIKTGFGNLTLNGANTYAGNTRINQGTLTFTGSTSNLGGNILNNAALVFNQAANSSFNQVISGNGTVTKTGPGNLTLTGNNTYTGNTTINGGILTFAGNTSNLGGNIINNAALVFNQAANSSFNQVISGAGTVTKSGAGNLSLTGNNTYTGNTTINGGILTFTGSTSGLGGNIINNAALVFNQAANSSFNQVISGAGTVTKSGAGNLILSGANTYTGNTTINDGILTFTGNTSNLGGNILNNAALVFNQAANSSFNQVITGAGTVTKTGAGTLTLVGNNTYIGGTFLNGGTLSVNANNRLGAAAGGLSFSGGTLRTTATFASNRVVTLNAGGGTFNTDPGTTLVMSGVIGGTGPLTKVGAGNLILSGANTYTGNTTINGGILTFTGNTSNLGGNILNNAALVFNQAVNSSFNQVISGNGTVTKSGTGVLTFTGANTYTGGTTIAQGTLLNNGSLASSVIVNPGAIYDGNGSSGSIINNGTVSPGAAIGFLTVNGDYSGVGRLLIEFNRTATDLLRATGIATLTGGSLLATTPTQFGEDKVYTILSAAGGVNGVFSQTQVPSNALLAYLPTAVQLFMPSQDIAPFVGEDKNPLIIARYLDAINNRGTVSSDLQTVFDALGDAVDRGGVALRDALNQISPDPYREIGYIAFDQTSMINQSISTHQQRLINSRIIRTLQPQISSAVNIKEFANHFLNQSLRGGMRSIAPTSYSSQRQHYQMPALGAVSPGSSNQPVRKAVQVGNSNVWIEPYGSIRRKSNSSLLAGTHSDTYGTTIGGDSCVAPNTYVGLLGGLIRTDFDWTQSRGHGHVKGYYGGLYGLWLSNTGAYVDGQVILGGERIRSKRNIRFETINRQARENHSGFVVSPELEIGYLAYYKKLIIQPFMNFAYTAAHENSFSEKGADSLNVRSPSKTSHFSRSEVGSVFSYFFTCRDTLIYPSLQLSWVQRRHLGSNGKDVKFKLSGQSFGTTVFGDNRVRNFFSPGIGLTAQFKNGLYITGDIKGEIGEGERAGQFMIEAGYTF